jgi:hypothetical protein
VQVIGRRILLPALLCTGLLTFPASPSLAASPTVAPCARNDALLATERFVGGAAGQVFFSIAITNDGPTSCSLSGAPRAQPVNIQSERPVAPASRYREVNNEQRGVIVIQNDGGRAYAMLTVGIVFTFSQKECAKTYATGIEIQPDESQRAYLPLTKDSTYVCTGRMNTFISAYSSKPY